MGSIKKMALFPESILSPIADRVPPAFQGGDFGAVVAFIFRLVIEFSAAVFLLLLLYGGVLYLTAAGSDEAVEKSKKVMVQALIGLIIVVASFGIGTWILLLLTGGEGGGQISNEPIAITLTARENSQSGKLLSDVLVSVSDDKGAYHLQGKTGSNGILNFGVSAPGERDLKATKSGFRDCQSQNLDFQGSGLLKIYLVSGAGGASDCKNPVGGESGKTNEGSAAPPTDIPGEGNGSTDGSDSSPSAAYLDGYQNGKQDAQNKKPYNPYQFDSYNTKQGSQDYQTGYRAGYASISTESGDSQSKNQKSSAYQRGYKDGQSAQARRISCWNSSYQQTDAKRYYPNDSQDRQDYEDGWMDGCTAG